MKRFILSCRNSAAMIVFGIWIFIVWRLTGMPSPGFIGRIVPLAWVLAGLLNGGVRIRSWFLPMATAFTAGAWLWMLHPAAWYIAAAVPVAGLVAWSFSVASRGRLGVVGALVPLLFLTLMTAEVNSDEVRFAELASRSSGIESARFGDSALRYGDLSREEGHHTAVFPLLISPGLLAGDFGLRVVPVILAVLGVLLLARLTDPRAAVAAALLYPGFSILGLAMTGWLALGLFTLAVLLPDGRKWTALRLLIALLLVVVKMRYAGLAAGIVFVEYLSYASGRAKWWIPLGGLAGLLLFLAADRYLLGGEIFWIRYGNTPAFRILLINVISRPLETISHAVWSLFDTEAGLLLRAPWILSAAAGLFLFRRRSPELFRKLFVPSLFYWVLLILWSGSGWHGLPAPAGRMFLPMLPLFACGLSSVWEERSTRILVMLSAAISALVITFTIGRYNYADGTDSLLSMMGTVSGFSMVRGHSLQLLVPLVLTVTLVVLLVRGFYRTGTTLAAVLMALLLLGLPGIETEMEDLPPGVLLGAAMHPGSPDPADRFDWVGSRERMLVLGEPGQSILLPDIHPGDTLVLRMSGKGGTLAVGGQLLTVDCPLREMYSAYNFAGRSERYFDDRPENRITGLFAVPVRGEDTENGSVRLSHHSGTPVYLDEYLLRRGSEP